MGDFGASKDKWVCPNDRELSLRAKLKIGWSVKTHSNNFNKPEQLNDAEQEVIMNVIRRAENLDKIEQERIGRLVERLDNMKKNAMGNGSTQCILCADEFGILGASPLLCNDCKKAVCTKCGVDTVSAHKEPLWLCKICAETRETWKKSGAWFYKGLPKYILPGKKTEPGRYPSTPSRTAENSAGSPARPYNAWLQSKGRSGSEKELTDSSDEEIKGGRLGKKATVRRPYAPEAAENTDTLSTAAPPADSSTQGPSPTHLHSPASPSVSPRSPHREASDKSPTYEGSAPYGKERRSEPDRSHAQAPSGSHWYKPGSRRENNPEEEYTERSFRGHPPQRNSNPSANRLRQVAKKEEETFEEKPSPEESSKKNNFFCRRGKRKKETEQ